MTTGTWLGPTWEQIDADQDAWIAAHGLAPRGWRWQFSWTPDGQSGYTLDEPYQIQTDSSG